VHHFAVAIFIRINGNAIQLLVQVCGLPQHDDGKDGGTEHGGVLRMAVAVPKLRVVHGDASSMCCVWQRRRFVAPWIGKNINDLMPVFDGRMSFTNWVQERKGSNTYCRQWTTDMMKHRTSLASSRSSTTTHPWKSRKPWYTWTSSSHHP
jgi:hypothetical protein